MKLNFLHTLMKYQRSLLKWALAGVLLSGTATFFSSDKYTATTLLLPPPPIQFVSSEVFSNPLTLESIKGGSPRGLRRTAMRKRLQMGVQPELVVGILKSDRLAENLITRFGLAAHYKLKKPVRSALIKRLKTSTKITDGKDGLIEITVTDKHPEMAMRLANGYVEEYARLTQTLAVGEAAVRKVFFEKQTQQAWLELSRAEVALKSYQVLHGVLDPDLQTGMLLKLTQAVRARIATTEVALQVAGTMTTESNPETIRLQTQLTALRGQLKALIDRHDAGVSSRPSLGEMPGFALEYARAERDVEDALSNYQMHARQYEMAKMDVAQDLSAVKVVDKAVIADAPRDPRRWRTMLVVTLLFISIAVARAFIKEAVSRSRGNPAKAERWAMFDQFRTWRRAS